jgi:hypothetical protein
MPGGLIVFAGHRRSVGSTLLVASLRREQEGPSLPIEAVLCVSEFTIRRAREWYRRYGRDLPAKVLGGLGFTTRTAFDEENEILFGRLRTWNTKETSIPALCRHLSIPWHVVPHLNSEKCLSLIRHYQPACAVYGGGGILRQPLLDALPGGILNLHSGPLPHIRGMNGVEWSLYHGLNPTTTLHLIDKGIDTGPVLASQTLAVTPGEKLGALRGRVILAGIDLLTTFLREKGLNGWKPEPTAKVVGLQYYTMSESLKAVVQSWLDRGLTPILDAAEVTPGDTTPAIQRNRQTATS